MKKNRLLLLTLLLLNGIVFSQPLPVQHSRHVYSSKKMMSPAQKMSFPINPSAIIFTDNMDGDNTVAGLVGRGYATYYRGGGPPGLFPEWFQGDSAAYASYNGPDSGYVTSTFNSVTGTNSLDNWLVLPAQNVVAGDSFSFFARSPTGSTFVDSARVMYNPSGATLPEDINWKAVIGVGFLGGIGFTMSIFITLLAFSDAEHIENSKIMILLSSLMAGIIGFFYLKTVLKTDIVEEIEE